MKTKVNTKGKIGLKDVKIMRHQCSHAHKSRKNHPADRLLRIFFKKIVCKMLNKSEFAAEKRALQNLLCQIAAAKKNWYESRSFFEEKFAGVKNCTIFASRFFEHPFFVHNLFKINEIKHEKG